MKIKIDNGPPYEDGTVYLRLYEADPDHIVVEAVYDYAAGSMYDPGGALLTITGAGRVALSPNIDPALGFPLDHDGRMMMDEFCEAATARRGKRASLVVDNTVVVHNRIDKSPEL